MQLDLPIGNRPSLAATLAEEWLRAGETTVRARFVKHRRARRYLLRLLPDGTARVTIPRGGSLAEARAFASRHASWLGAQVLRHAAAPAVPVTWQLGTEILLQGEPVVISLTEGGVRLAGERVRLVGPVEPATNLRPALERHLWRLARRELPARVSELAALHGVAFRRVTVRNQRSRWGSCSRRGTVSLNWRLVQAPASVRDYIILHELAHVKELNHSRRFWAEVARICPDYARAESWLKTFGPRLR